jgi:hypothetical protein
MTDRNSSDFAAAHESGYPRVAGADTRVLGGKHCLEHYLGEGFDRTRRISALEYYSKC